MLIFASRDDDDIAGRLSIRERSIDDIFRSTTTHVIRQEDEHAALGQAIEHLLIGRKVAVLEGDVRRLVSVLRSIADTLYRGLPRH